METECNRRGAFALGVIAGDFTSKITLLGDRDMEPSLMRGIVEAIAKSEQWKDAPESPIPNPESRS
jgi:hypothetical protein